MFRSSKKKTQTHQYAMAVKNQYTLNYELYNVIIFRTHSVYIVIIYYLQ